MEWDKVFTAGKHTDSNGNVKVWTVADLDRMVASFNPAYHEPPVVIGHPSDNAPAFGWVSGIKRVGNDLYLQYRDVADQFREWVTAGLYRKKSIAVYPDGSLRHVGYLGAVPPAIKGLPDFAFKAGGEFATYEAAGQGFWEKMRNLVGEFFSDTSGQSDNSDVTITQEDEMTKDEVQGIVAEAIEGIAGQIKAVGDAVQGLNAQFAELAAVREAEADAARLREFNEFLATPEMQKRIPESGRQATVNQMILLTKAAPVEFGEGDAKQTVPAVEHYKNELKALPELVTFSEVAVKDKAEQKQTTATRSEFEAWSPARRHEFSCAGGMLID